MDALLRLSDFIDTLNRRVGQAAMWLILGSVLLSALTATLRYTLDWGSNAMIEGQWFMFGLVFLLCAPWTLLERGHVRVDILHNRLPPRVRVGIDILGGLLFLLPVCVLIIVDAWNYFLISFHQNEASYNPGGLIWWPMKLAIPVGFTLLALQGVSEVIKGFGALTGRRPLPAAQGGD
ncbi:TRAP transporter small permease subunit [Thiorhodococcus mannitoliphagus]|uniref:TRAP transporter small permease protein n=1 Tax=Thiorhodococcus mannitoliphagus TaxID=329406 RepID=A0A6P1DRZ3_9GAMM|nr:TRAP transporter small permease subunit [Thiorhodococcus mannitoliphagus]NEX20818.1 TRAP transporter small permease subunit [Thiorhodococcus mannitoliphagus]